MSSSYRVAVCAVKAIFSVAWKGLCVYRENTSDLWDILGYTTRKRCTANIYHVNFGLIFS